MCFRIVDAQLAAGKFATISICNNEDRVNGAGPPGPVHANGRCGRLRRVLGPQVKAVGQVSDLTISGSIPGGRLFDVVEHQYVEIGFPFFELQSKFLFESC